MTFATHDQNGKPMKAKPHTKSEPMFTTSGKIAEVVGCSHPSPLNWWKAGQIPGVKLGNTVRFPIAEVAAILGIDPEALRPDGDRKEGA